MRHLLILRHGKATKKPGFEDHERPLTGRGRRQAHEVGLWLTKNGPLPDLMLSSTAQRALSTAAIAASSARFEGLLRTTQSLYKSGANAHAGVLQKLADPAERVLLAGHNPDLEQLVAQLVGKSARLGTAGVAVLELEISNWAELRLDGRAKLAELWHPGRGD